MAEVLDIDLSDDRLISLAALEIDSHNYMTALKLLNKCIDSYGADEDAFMLYAEAFDDLGLYEKSINNWFAYLDCAMFPDYTESYEGIAIGYMNVGNDHFAAFYYNKLLQENKEMDIGERDEIIREFMSSETNPLKFAYPPALADCTDVISKGIEHMKAGEYDAAVKVFDEIAAGNPKYFSARNYIAMCKIITDKNEEAEQECLNILKDHPDNVQALTTLAAVKTESGKHEEAKELAKKLIAMDAKETDEIYKIATVCCENKLHAEAYELFCKLPPENNYDLNILFFKAVSAFNAGKAEESLNAFDDLVTVYPDAETGKYFYKLARDMISRGDMQELSYFYRLPDEVRESTLKILAAYARLSPKAAAKLAEEVDLSSCVKWCFDECEGKGIELQLLGAQVAVKAEMENIVRSLLLNAFIDDRVKIELLLNIAERNRYRQFSVVICNVLRNVIAQPLKIGRAKKKQFVSAYARLFAHFAMLDDVYGTDFAIAAGELYKKLAEENRLDCVKDLDALTAAIYVISDVRAAEIEGDKIYSFFEVTKEQVDEIIGE